MYYVILLCGQCYCYKWSFHITSVVVALVSSQFSELSSTSWSGCSSSSDYANAVASLGLVSPGVATEGVSPIFCAEKLTTFFCSSLSLFDFLGVTPQLFYMSNLICSLFFVNSPSKNIFSLGCYPPGASPLVMPLC